MLIEVVYGHCIEIGRSNGLLFLNKINEGRRLFIVSSQIQIFIQMV